MKDHDNNKAPLPQKNDKDEELLVDESEVEEELEHLEEQKKRREKRLKEKRRKRGRVLLIIVVLAAAAIAAFFIARTEKAKQEAQDETASIETAEDEEIVYVKVTSINGNDMDVAILKEAAVDSTDTAETADGTHGAPSADGTDSTHAAPAADGTDSTQGMSAPGGMQGGPQGTGSSSEEQYTDTGETKTYEIPVGTDVITKMGMTTTFSRISAENTLALVVKKDTDNIVRIYIR